MRLVLTAMSTFIAAAGVIVFASSTATAQNAPDFATCSGNYRYCVVGTAQIRMPSLDCRPAYDRCMQTGIWQSYGKDARTLTRVIKK